MPPLLNVLPILVVLFLSSSLSAQDIANTAKNLVDRRVDARSSNCPAEKINQTLAYLVDNRSRPNVAEVMQPIIRTVDAGPINAVKEDWDSKVITVLCPALIVIHMHTFRTGGTSYPVSEERLVRGLRIIHKATPLTRIVVYSSSFTDKRTDVRFITAAFRLSPEDYGREFLETIDSLKLLRWPLKPQLNDNDRLEDVVKNALAELKADLAGSATGDKLGANPESNGAITDTVAPTSTGSNAVDSRAKKAETKKDDQEGPLKKIENFFTSLTGIVLSLAALVTALIALFGPFRSNNNQSGGPPPAS